MKKYKAIIFDMDGTIVDTVHVSDKANILYLQQKGINNKKLFIRLKEKLKGVASIETAKIIKTEANIQDDAEVIMDGINKICRTLFNQNIRYIKGFEQFHSLIKSKNIPTAIATNADRDSIIQIDSILNLQKHFGKYIYGRAEVNFIQKPSPDIYLHVAKELNIHPHDCIAFEDSICGVSAVKNAQMYCIAINTSNIRAMLSEADKIIDDYNEINLDELV